MKSLIAKFAGIAPGSSGADRHGRAPFFLTLLLGLAMLSGCGAGGGGGVPPPSGAGDSGGGGGGVGDGGADGGSSGSTAVLLKLGEYATVPDDVVFFELTMDFVSLRSSKGDVVPLLTNPRRIELSALKAEPLLLGRVANGNYSGLLISFSNPEISYIDSSGVLHEKVPASLSSATATNASEFSLDSTPREINIHPLFFRSSSAGAVTATPSVNFSTVWERPTKNLVGRIISTGTGSLGLDVHGLPPAEVPGRVDGALTFAIDSSTAFQGLDDPGELTAGMTVEVDAVLGSGGTLRATRVSLENDDASKVVVEGLTLSTCLDQLRISVREVHGPFGVLQPGVGNLLTVDADASTRFQLRPDDIDLANLDFTPAFDAHTIAPGQNVRAAASSGSASTVTADRLELAKQSLDGRTGVVLPGSVSGQFSFPLDVSADSAFARLTGHTSVLVTLQPSTEKFFGLGFEGCVQCFSGTTVRVRGLLFFSGGQYRLVADWFSPIYRP